MSVTNPERIVTKQDLKDFYDGILPYLGGSVEAGFTPIGTIIAVMGNAAPTNYLACNGQTVNISDYPELANYFLAQFGSRNKFGGNGTTTFGIPDLRGEFLRGTGTNSHSDCGNGSAVGTHQTPTYHHQVLQYYNGSNQLEVGTAAPASAESFADAYQDTTVSTDQYTGGVISATRRTSDPRNKYITSRPTNTSVLFCIATKNIYMNPALDYTTEEKVVGQWIDGKSIYQRTFTGTMPSTFQTSGTMVDVSVISNIDKMIDVRGFIETKYNSEYGILPIGYTNVDLNSSNVWTNGYTVYAYLTKGTSTSTLSIVTKGPTATLIMNTRPYYLTVQYTKSTD